MPYICRDASKAIVSIKRESDAQHTEFLRPAHPEVIDFLSVDEASVDLMHALFESDHYFARATEDLIQLLIQKNMILFTDLPVEVQANITAREKLRSDLNATTSHSFLDDGDAI